MKTDMSKIGTIKRLRAIGLSRPLPTAALITKTNNHDGHKGRQISPKSANIKKCARFYKATNKCEVGARNVGACLSTYTCPFINGPRTIR